MVGEVCSRGVEGSANICTEGQIVTVVALRWKKGVMRAAQEGINLAAVGDGSQDSKANLLYEISVVCKHQRKDAPTSSPVQNIGHLFHGEIRTSPSQVLR